MLGNKENHDQVGQRSSLKEDYHRLQESARTKEDKKQFFELLISSLPGIFYLFDESYKMLHWNDNAERVTGFSEESIHEMNLQDFFDEEDWISIIDVIKTAFEHGNASGEARLLNRDGLKTPYIFHGASTEIDGKKYLLGTGLDVTKLKEAEEKAKENEALYQLFAKRMTEGVILSRDYRILFTNRAAKEIFGYGEGDELVNYALDKIIDSDFLVSYRDMFDSLASGKCDERRFEGRGVSKGGRELWIKGKGTLVSWKGRPTVLFLFRDVTEARIREMNMQEEADHLRRENVILRNSINDRFRFGSIIGKSQAMQKVYDSIISASSAARANVIIFGESGTGKELVAKEIHDNSERRSKRFVTVNCAAIPDSLLESEFFGCKKGAFTGATSDRKGYLELADGGTLFLDEIGELDINLQAKLLRAIDGGGFTPVGENYARDSDFRIVAATNRNLEEMIKQGKMREDFYYRIHIIPITLPPLRSRKEDIPLLVEHLLRIYSGDGGGAPIQGATMDALTNHYWRGNVRELKNVIQRYLSEKNFDFIVGANCQEKKVSEGRDFAATEQQLKDQVNLVERKMLVEAITRFKGNKSKAAKALGITRKTLLRKMICLGL